MSLFLQHCWKRTAAAYAFFCLAAFGQSTLAPAFEVASVKAAASDSRARPAMRGGPGTPDAGQITYTNVTLTSVVLRAYDVQSYQATGPDWLSSLRYDIAAKLPPGTTKEQFQRMLQNLLAERFHLALHHETRDLQGYEVVAAKNGPKLKASLEPANLPAAELASPPKRDANGFPQLDAPGLAMMEGVRGKAVVSYLTARAQPLSALTEMLSREFRLPILDKTGLTGKFDFTLEFAPQSPGALSPSVDDSAPDLLTALPQQLGLKLNPAKVPTDILIIDRADRVPTGN